MVVSGIDVSKHTLYVHVRAEESASADDEGIDEAHSDGSAVSEDRKFSNDRQGFRSLRKWLRRKGVTRVVIEPTGRFHRQVHHSLHDDGFEVVQVNPLRSRRFAEAKGDLAKTDRVDAAMLAAYGQAFPKLAPSEPKGAFFERLESLLVGRERLVDTSVSLRQSGSELDASVGKILIEYADQMKNDISTLEASIKAHILSDPDMAPRYRILRSVPAIGPVNAAMLCCQMPELGSIGNRQAASLIGVAPFSRDSGKAQGARHIRGGRQRPRDTLYMAAMSAIRWNPEMKALYERLTAGGKKHKVALVAVMRKLIVLVNVLLRDGRDWATQAPQNNIPSCR